MSAPTLFDYARFVEDLEHRIDGARLSAARAVNRELVALHWDIGPAIREQQARRAWGDAVVDLLARDLKASFPPTIGFSAASLAHAPVSRDLNRAGVFRTVCEKGGAISSAPKFPTR